MKKLYMRNLVLISSIIMLLSFASCSSEQSNVGRLYVSANRSKSVVASIEYTSVYEAYWTITATKTDGGEEHGHGVYADVLLTDFEGIFSTGTWNFTLEGYLDSTKIYEGTKDVSIISGDNVLEVEVYPTGSNGTLSLEDCNFVIDNGRTLVLTYLIIDSSCIGNHSAEELEYSGGTYTYPDTSIDLTAGVHTIAVKYSYAESTVSLSKIISLKIRIEPNATTHLSFGTDCGSISIVATVNEQDAIVE